MVDKKEKLRRLRKALSETPGIYREALALKYVHGRSDAEIAMILKKKLSSDQDMNNGTNNE